MSLTSVVVLVLIAVLAVQSKSQMLGEPPLTLLACFVPLLVVPKPGIVTAGGHKKIADHQNDARVQEVAQFAVKQVRLCHACFRTYTVVS